MHKKVAVDKSFSTLFSNRKYHKRGVSVQGESLTVSCYRDDLIPEWLYCQLLWRPLNYRMVSLQICRRKMLIPFLTFIFLIPIFSEQTDHRQGG